MTQKKNAELTIKRLPLAKLIPHHRNPRAHPEPDSAEWTALKTSLEHDFFDPLVVNLGRKCPKLKNVLVSGHLRTKVLMEAGYSHADSVVVDYDAETHEARMIAANRNVGEWDDAALAALLKGLADGGLEPAISGMTAEQLAEILAAATIPAGNKPIDEGAMAATENECPKCSFKW